MWRDVIHTYSIVLQKEMTLRVYGQGGLPILVFPCQDAMSDNFENFGMIDCLSDFLENSQIRLFCVDSIDQESWSNKNGDKAWRAWRQDQYFYYIADEVVPFIHEYTGSADLPYLTGCSMGANHAAITFLRAPELFAGMIALSGVYDATYFWDGWCNDTLYRNSPTAFIPNMPGDHPFIRLYNEKDIIFCIGQGAWEEEGLRTQRELDTAFAEKGIHAWFDYWGYDVNHDWPWWKKQLRYFLMRILYEKKYQQQQ